MSEADAKNVYYVCKIDAQDNFVILFSDTDIELNAWQYAQFGK